MNVADAQTVEDLIRAVPAEHRSLFEEFVQARFDAKRVREMSARLEDARASMREMEAAWGENVAAGERARRQQARLAELETENKRLVRELDSWRERFTAEHKRVEVLSREVDTSRATLKRFGLTA